MGPAMTATAGLWMPRHSTGRSAALSPTAVVVARTICLAAISVLVVLVSALPSAYADIPVYKWSFSVAEDAPIGSVIGHVSPVAPGMTLLNAAGVTASLPFAIDDMSGNLTTTNVLDSANASRYEIIVLLKSGTLHQVSIDVLDVNNHAPVFAVPVVNVTIAESTAIGSQIMQLQSAVDPDFGSNGTQGYRIVAGNDGGTFAVEMLRATPTNLFAVLRVNRTLDRSRQAEYQLVVQAYDGRGRSGNLTVNIRVSLVVDSLPRFDHSSYSATVLDNVTFDNVVLRVRAIDPELGNLSSVVYTVNAEASDPNQPFYMDGEGALRNWQRLSRLVPSGRVSVTFVLQIDATVGDPSLGRTASCSAVVRVVSLERAVPQIRVVPLLLSVPEDVSSAEPIVHLSVSDPMEGDGGPTSGSSSLDVNGSSSSTSSSGNGDPEVRITSGNDDGAFELRRAPAAGTQYQLFATAELTRSPRRGMLNMTVTAVSSVWPFLRAVGSLNISVYNVNRNAPSFDAPSYVAFLIEGAQRGTALSLPTAIARDPDGGINGQLTYSLAPVVGRHSNWFAVNATTGIVSVAVDGSSIDCEADAQPSFLLVATDGGIPKLSANTTVLVNIINVNDVAPVFLKSTFLVSVSEDQPPGSCFLQLNATDGDCGSNGGNLSFAVMYDVGGSAISDLNVTTDGRVCIAKPLDFERQRSYTVGVRVMDAGGLSSNATVVVQVTDVNDNLPVFYPLFYFTNVNSQMLPGSSVIAVSATDADGGVWGYVKYELLSTNGSDYFRMNATTGTLSLSLSLAGLAAPRTFYLIVRAIDGGGRASATNANVTVVLVGLAGRPPRFAAASYAFAVGESSPTGAYVGTVSAISDDGSNVMYSISSGDRYGWFRVNAITGSISVAGLLDREVADAVVLYVQAASGTPPVFSAVLVNLTIDDVNDNAPTFPLPIVYLHVVEDAAIGSVLFTAVASDRDRGVNGSVRYRLIWNEESVAAVDSLTGVLTLEAPLDYELKKQYNVTVQAYDLGAPTSLTADLVVMLQIDDVNDNAPTFSCQLYEFMVNESLAVGEIIGQVVAADRDVGAFGNVTYSLAGEAARLFSIDRRLGTVRLAAELDRERQHEHSLIVTAADGGQPPLSSVAAIVIKVLDANDNPPVFHTSAYRFAVVENLASGVPIGTVLADDPDLGPSEAGVLYTLLTPTTDFVLNASSGTIYTATTLDRERVSVYLLVVQAADGEAAALSSTVTVTVDVLDVNDNAPVFPWLVSADAFVSENLSVGALVDAFTAFDPDLDLNGTLVYSLVAGDTGNFSVNATTGWITTTSVFDREVKNTYSVTLVASDRGSPSRNASLLIVVRILDVNEPPKFNTSHISVTVQENIPIGTVVGRVSADDYDVGSNAVIYYFVGARSSGNVFDVNSQTGEIVNADVVDYEQAKFHWMLVVARDSGYLQQLSTTVNVTVTVTDVNDNRPTFIRDPSVFYVVENALPGYVVGVVKAIDADSGPNGVIVYSVVDNSSQVDSTWRYLTVEPRSGRIVTVDSIDCETTQMLFLVVRVEDQAVNASQRLAATNTLVVVVVNENDNAPVFLTPNRTAVLEDEPIGFPVMVVAAVDGDVNDAVHYTIISGNEGEKFALDGVSGVLTLQNSLDREMTASYSLNISATDSGYPPQSTALLLRVDVIDVNDNPPLFERSMYIANVTEGGLPNGTVIRLVATDADEGVNARLLYIIPNGSAGGLFSIDGDGLITTTASLDRESCSSYVFTAYVRDSAYPALYDQTTVLINVTDINDNAPEFASAVFQQRVAEIMPGLTVVWQMVAYDADEGQNGQVYYNITGGNEGDVFSIDPDTGIVRSLPLDRESVSSYYLAIKATDKGVPALSNVTYLNVTVDDVNDNNPNFTQTGSYRIAISEDMPRGTSVLTVYATDRDSGDNARLVYYLDGLSSNDSGSCPDCDGKFAISADNGTIYTTGVFDREKKASYMFYVKVSDSAQFGPRVDQRIVEVTILDVNDNVPIFASNPMFVNVSSVTHQPTPALYTVRATDKDLGPNGTVEYVMLNSTGPFQIGRTSGDLVATAPLAGLPPVQRIRVRAVDRGSPPKYSDGVIEIRLDSTAGPSMLRFPNTTYSIYLDENTPVGVLVITVTATLVGSHAPIVYSLTGDASSDTQPFSISQSSGEIRVSDSSLLDFEVVQRFRMVVIAVADQSIGVQTDYCTVIVTLRDVNDNAPVFTLDRYTARVWESLPRDTYVTKVAARDADDGLNGIVDYSIQNPTAYPQSMFNIISPSGIVSTTGPLDRELIDVIRITIVASDRGEPRQSTTCVLRVTVVDVNDNWPVISNANHTVNVSESLEVGKTVLTLIGQDPDVSPQLTYGFERDSAAGNPFSIDSLSGMVTLARSLDRETDSSYVRMVFVDDSNHRSYANVTINVLDVNDNAPVFGKQSYEVSVLEDMPVGTQLVQVVARDADEGTNGAVGYTLQGTEAVVDRFAVDPLTGWISTRRIVTYSAQEPVAQLVVTATDGGEPPLSSVVFVRVTVLDVNNYAPQFSLAQYTVHVSEEARPLTIIFRLEAQDKDDSPENKKVDYSITSGNTDVFELAMNTGELSVIGPLDREAVQKYQLVVMASDRGIPSKNSTVTVTVMVEDANDNAPVFNKSEYVVTVPESVPAGSLIMQVHATDNDVGGNGVVEYMIVSGNDDNLFSMNVATGEISLNSGKELDYERHTEHRMTVRAMDNGLPRQVAITGVVINVTDVNDFGPQFERLMYLETVKENYPAGSFVFRAYARDADAGVFGQVTYGLIGANDHFQIDPATGYVTTAVVFDFEAVPKYRFNVTATDRGGRYAIVQVQVQVLGQDEHRPAFERSKYTFEVEFTAEVSRFIGQVSATDRDQGDEGRVVYALKDPNWYYSVEHDSGRILVAHKLNEPDGSSTTAASGASGSNVKSKRSADGTAVGSGGIVPENEALVILASSGLPDSLVGSTIVQIQVTGYPDPSATQSAVTAPGLTGISLGLVIGFAVFATILLIVIIVLCMRGRRRKQRGRNGHLPSGSMSAAVTDVSVVPDNIGGYHLPTSYADFRLANHATNTRLSPTHTDSSGRGSTGLREEDDEEIRAINSSYPTVQPQQTVQSAVVRNNTMPDSGIQRDDDTASLQSAKDHHEYLARLGIDTSKVRGLPLDKKSESMRSVESMHHFSDEGGGEADSMDLSANVYQKLVPSNSGAGATLRGMEMPATAGAGSGTQQRTYGSGSAADVSPAAAVQGGGSLSSVADSGEELTGSYSWDYLLDWGPEYQPLADVFAEIARLKDESVQPKRQPVKTVPVHNITSRLPASSKMEPPPIITNVPPKAGPPGRLESNHASARTSQLTSMASLPRSPISHESSFSNLAMSPTFTPVLSPLATTRSPSVSTIHTTGASDRGTPRGPSAPLRNNLIPFAQSSAAETADTAEAEMRI